MTPFTDKEVEGFYDDGMRVPDDITLLWTDDKYVQRYIVSSRITNVIICSWGNIRRFPTIAERNRTGGAGVYYHVSLVPMRHAIDN